MKTKLIPSLFCLAGMAYGAKVAPKPVDEWEMVERFIEQANVGQKTKKPKLFNKLQVTVEQQNKKRTFIIVLAQEQAHKAADLLLKWAKQQPLFLICKPEYQKFVEPTNHTKLSLTVGTQTLSVELSRLVYPAAIDEYVDLIKKGGFEAVDKYLTNVLTENINSEKMKFIEAENGFGLFVNFK